MQSNVKPPVSAHHIFRTETKASQGCPSGGGGKNTFPYMTVYYSFLPR